MNETLAQLAAAAGIEADYWDALGTRRELEEPTATAVLRALGLDPDGDREALRGLLEQEAASHSGDADAALRCFIPERLAAGGRCWGLSIQLYSLRSRRNWGVGDLTDLAQLVQVAGRAGAAIVGINPLHARHLARPDEASPYSPASRRFLDPMILDVEAVPDFRECAEAMAAVDAPEFQARLESLRATPWVDHAAVSAMKLPILARSYESFRARHGAPDDERARQFAAFRARHGEPLARYGEFEALGVMPELPIAARIEFHAYLQWEASRQLDAVAAVAGASGEGVVLYRDLAVGVSRDSAAARGDPALVVPGISVGAPPDQFSRNGQNWGLPPWNPRELARRGYEPFAALLAANMEGAGALRIDHVMSLARLFWIPDGMPATQGAYVRYPFDALATVVAAESQRHRCMVIGEDLGSVPDGLREHLHARGFLSYRVLLFERHWQGDGSLKRPHEYPAQALATVVTHDMPTIADYWTFGDIERRARLGLFADDEARAQETARRHDERWKVLALLNDLGLTPADPEDTGQIAEALHAAIARTASMIAIVQLDDVLGEIEPANIPGTNREYPNWRRKLSATLDDIAADARLTRLAEIMRQAGRGRSPASPPAPGSAR